MSSRNRSSTNPICSSSCDVAGQCARFIFDELLATEQQYVEDLSTGITRYGRIFDLQTESESESLPDGLVGQQQVLLSNVAQIAALHRLKLLPLMLQHRQHLELLFERWYTLIERGYFNCYVLFIACQRYSFQVYDSNVMYFKRLQITLGDPLGVRSFLLKPMQRVTRYPLMLNKFIQKFYENRQLISKRVFELACRLEKRTRELLECANQADQLNDIEHFNPFSMLSRRNFIMTGEFMLNDGQLRRTYNGKLFAFNTCLIYTEGKGRTQQLLRGNFILPDICFVAKSKSFKLCNKHRECEFLCQPALVQKWESVISHLLEAYLDMDKVKASRAEENAIGPESSTADAGQDKVQKASRTTWYAVH